jgi:hypothetical protein
MIFLLAGLLAVNPATAQSSDTVRVGEDTTATSVTDTAQEGNRDLAGHTPERTEPVVVRSIPDSIARQWKNSPDFAYANDPEYWRREHREYRNTDPGWFFRFLVSKGFRYTFIFVICGILLYAIIRIIAENSVQMFYRSPAKRQNSGGKEETGPVEEDIDGQLTHFMQIKDYRQAVRYLYLKSLRLLVDRGMIRFHQQSTNQEYLRQLSALPQAAPFRELTIAYEKVWYGEFPINEGQFGRLHSYFEDFFKTCRP